MSSDEIRKNIIENYIDSYNTFEIENMLKDLDENIVFRNIANGEINLTTKGIAEFKAQAEQAKNLFSRREQKITNLKFGTDEVEAEIFYSGTIAVDFPDGLKAGSKIELAGKSIFRFSGNKIIEIEDIS
jgi:repressor of nif and glnA expression